MVETYNVARGTLREALRYLEFQGALTFRPGPNGGPVVMQPTSRHLAQTLGLQLQFGGATYGDILQARLALEPPTAARAAENMTDEVLARLRDSIDAMREELQDRDRFFEENAVFHDLVARASNNVLFSQLVEALHGITDGGTLGAEYPVVRRQRVVEAHKGILDAIAARSPEKAEDAMRGHVLAFIRYTRRHHRALYDLRLNWDHFPSLGP